MKSDTEQNYEQVIIDRFEGDKAVLMLDREEFFVPKKLIPKEAGEGQTLIFNISTDADENEKRQKTAKELLNEILN